MFTGIIKKTAKVKYIEKNSGGLSLEVLNPKLNAKKGDSMAVNGVCSTVVKTGRLLGFQYMPETLACSAMNTIVAGDLVNLEPSLKVSDRLDGHIVLGHVDEVGEIVSIKAEGNSKVLTLAPREPKRFMKFIAEKGSVALDGVSLTVVGVNSVNFTVKLIPYTLEHTVFKDRKVGSEINIEFDILAKYLDKLKCK